MGPDIRYKDGKVVTDVSVHPNRDAAVKGLKGRINNGDYQALHLSDEIIKNTYRTLMTRGMKGCYVFCCDSALSDYLKSLLIKVEKKEHEPRIEAVVSDSVKYVDFLPFYSLKAACGYFGEGEEVEEQGWIHVDGMGKLNRNMFVVKASGDSMEPTIHDGDYCVFRANPAGSRQGKIVLVQNHMPFDPEYGGSYAIKQYLSEKRYNDDGSWLHSNIVLKPLNERYTPIVLDELESEDFRVIGEFLGVVNCE